MRKNNFFKRISSLALAVSLMTQIGLITPVKADYNNDSRTPDKNKLQPENNYIVDGDTITFTVDDNVTDITLDHYFTYNGGVDPNGATGWGTSDAKASAPDGFLQAEGKTQHWVWNDADSGNIARGLTYSFTFTGTGAELIGIKNDSANVFTVDKGIPETKTYSSGGYISLFKVEGLEYGKHTIEVSLPETGVATGLQVSYAQVFGVPKPTPPPPPADKAPELTGAIVGTDLQWTQEHFEEIYEISNDTTLHPFTQELNTWQNDKALSEIALLAVAQEYTNVTVTASDVTSANGTKLAGAIVTPTFIRSTDAWAGGNPGYASDKPVPQGNRQESPDILWSSDPVTMTANSVQNVFVEVYIPKTATAGTYETTLTVTATGLATPLEFTYTINVADALLPDATEFKNGGFDVEFWQYPYSSAEYYNVEPFGPEHMVILESIMGYYKELGGSAITASIIEDAWGGQTYSENEVHYPSMIKWTKGADGVMTYDYTDFDTWVQFNKDLGIGDKIVLYSIAPWHNSFTYWENGVLKTEPYAVGSDEYKAMWDHFFTDLIAHLNTKGWFDQTYIGIDERGFDSRAFDAIEATKDPITGKSLKKTGAADAYVKKWDLIARMDEVSIGDTAHGVGGDKYNELIEMREKNGQKTTLYSCVKHKPGQFSLSNPAESYWIIANARKQGGTGFLRWALDAWVADPLNDTTHNAFEAGDCFLVFPDKKDATTPIVRRSVRSEKIAEGVRDVNKLMVMEKEIPAFTTEIDKLFEEITFTPFYSQTPAFLPRDHVAVKEAQAFKAGLTPLTNKFIDLRDNGINVVESVVINETITSIENGKIASLSTTMLPTNLLDSRVTFSSSDDSIATVSADGTVKGMSVGNVVITATSVADTTKSDSINIEITRSLLLTVDDNVIDTTLDHYFAYVGGLDPNGSTGWGTSNANPGTNWGNNLEAEGLTQHWVWSDNARELVYSFTFTGTGAEIFGIKNDQYNIFTVDSNEPVTIDYGSQPTGALISLFKVQDLPYGKHTINVTLPADDTLVNGLQVSYAQVFGADLLPPVVNNTATIVSGTGSGDYATGDIVTIKADSKSGYSFYSWTSSNANVVFENASSSETTFTMIDEDVTITANYSKNSGGGGSKPKPKPDPIPEPEPTPDGLDNFTDVSNHWAHDSIEFVVEQGLFNGVTDTDFAPNANATRSMILTVLYRNAGEPNGTSSVWYEEAVKWAKELGISDGANLDGNITREQLATMLYRLEKSPNTNGDLNKYSDSDNVSTYAVDALTWATSEGIVSGNPDGTLNPQGNATRAEVATMLTRYIK